MWIMVAGPYTTGAASRDDRERNLAELNRVAVALFRKGHVPIVGVNLALPVCDVAGGDSYHAIMTPLCLALAERCDAVLRLDGASSGADQEVEKIRARGGVVYRSLDDVPDATPPA
jgi:hypothetical protein